MSDKLGDAIIELKIKDLQFEQKLKQSSQKLAASVKAVGDKINIALGQKQQASIKASAIAIAAAGKRSAAVAGQQTAQLKAQTIAIKANASAASKQTIAQAAASAMSTKAAAAVSAANVKAKASVNSIAVRSKAMSNAKGIQLKLNQNSFNQQLNNAASRHAQAMANMQAKSNLSINLRRQRDAAKGSGSDQGGFLQNAGAVAAGTMLVDGLKMAGGFAKDLVTQGVMYNAQIEQMKTGFTQLLGSERQAVAMLAEARKYAAQTPFEMPDISQMAVKLLATRKIAQSEVMPVIKKLGDAAAGSANGFQSLPHITKAITDMLGKGVIHAQEMNQLAEAGIPAWSMLAEAMGVSEAEARKMSEANKVGMKEIMGLVDKLGEKYSGMAVAQSKTFLGMVSTLKDNVGMALGDVFKPLFESARKVMAGVIKMMDGKQFNAIVKSIASAIGGVMSVVEGIVQSPMAMFIAKVATVTAGILATVGAASILSGLLGGLATTLAPFVIPIAAAVAGMTLLATLVQRAFDGPAGKKFLATLDACKTSITEIGTNIYKAIIPALNSVGKMLASVFGGAGSIQAGFSSFISGIINRLRGLLDFLSVLSSDWGAAWDYMKAKSAAIAISIWEEFKYTLNERIPFAVAAMVDGTIAGFTALVNQGQAIFQSFGKLIVNVFDAIVSSIKNGFQAAMDIVKVRLEAAQEAWNEVKAGKLGNAAQKIVDGEEKAAEIGGKFLEQALADMQNPINTFGKEISQVGKDVGKSTMDAFKNTMGAMPPRVASTMETIAHNLANKMFGEMKGKRDDNRRADKTGAFLSGMLGSAKGGLGAAGDSIFGWIDSIKGRVGEFAAMFGKPAEGQAKKDAKDKGSEFVGVAEMSKRLQANLGGNEEKKDRKAAVKATLDVKEETKKTAKAVGDAVAAGSKATVAAIAGLGKSLGFGD